MDNEEVKAAIQRLSSNEREYWWAVDFIPQAAKDARLVAAAYADAHPPDEDEPITPEWLPTIGAEYNDREGFITQWAYVPEHADECVFIEKHDSDEHYTLRFDCECAWPLPLYTRGQLLRLLKELEQ